jgi:hypothetical protein
MRTGALIQLGFCFYSADDAVKLGSAEHHNVRAYGNEPNDNRRQAIARHCRRTTETRFGYSDRGCRAAACRATSADDRRIWFQPSPRESAIIATA